MNLQHANVQKCAVKNVREKVRENVVGKRNVPAKVETSVIPAEVHVRSMAWALLARSCTLFNPHQVLGQE